MPRPIEGWRRLAGVFRRRTLEGALDAELRFHVEQQADKHVQAGMSREAAERRALIELGGLESTKERTRDEFRAASVEHIARDLRYGWRALWRAPGFTLVAVLTLALGIGATTAMFTVVNGVLLRPLPYPDQDRLIEVVHGDRNAVLDGLLGSPAAYFGYRDHNRTLDGVGLFDWDSSPVTVTGSGEPTSVPSLEVTHEVLPLLGATPILGRTFASDDDRPGSPATVMISHGYWMRAFAGVDPVGRTLVVEGVPRQIIGVLPDWFRFFDYPADIFYPRQPVRATARFPSGDGRAIARLKPGVTLQQANADVARMIPLLLEEFGNPNRPAEPPTLEPRLRPLRDSVIGDLGDTLWTLLGTIGILLLIACANVANLVLVRTQTRRAELVLRAALGAGWAAVARVVVTESIILGAAGGAIGLVVAYASLPLLLSLGAADLPGIMTIAIDPRVLLVTAGTAIVVTVLFAAAPLLHLALPSLQLAPSLAAGGRTGGGRPQAERARQALLVAQVAMALVLLVGTGLMVRTFYTLRQVDPGFADPNRTLTFQLTLPREELPADAAARTAFLARILRTHHDIAERLGEIADVEFAGFVSGNDGLPLDGDGRTFALVPFVDGRQAEDGRVRVWENQRVSPGFFEALGTSLVAGRHITWDEVHDRRPVMVLSESIARKEFGSAAAAVGRRVGPDPTNSSEIVGVIEDVHHGSLSEPVTDTTVVPAAATPTAVYAIRSARVGTPGFLGEVRRAVWSVNANLSPATVQTMGELYERSMTRTSMTLQLLTITGGMALLLGLLGVYGLVSYAVSQRHREIGVRLALGARGADVHRMFVRRALLLVGIGVVIGLGSAAGLTRLIASQLFGVRPLDPWTLGAVALGLSAAAAAASYLSARRGSAINPVEVLRG